MGNTNANTGKTEAARMGKALTNMIEVMHKF